MKVGVVGLGYIKIMALLAKGGADLVFHDDHVASSPSSASSRSRSTPPSRRRTSR